MELLRDNKFMGTTSHSGALHYSDIDQRDGIPARQAYSQMVHDANSNTSYGDFAPDPVLNAYSHFNNDHLFDNKLLDEAGDYGVQAAIQNHMMDNTSPNPAKVRNSRLDRATVRAQTGWLTYNDVRKPITTVSGSPAFVQTITSHNRGNAFKCIPTDMSSFMSLPNGNPMPRGDIRPLRIAAPPVYNPIPWSGPDVDNMRRKQITVDVPFRIQTRNTAWRDMNEELGGDDDRTLPIALTAAAVGMLLVFPLFS